MGDLGDFDAGDLDIGSIGASFEDPTSHGGEHHGSRSTVPGQESVHQQQHHVEGDENMVRVREILVAFLFSRDFREYLREV